MAATTAAPPMKLAVPEAASVAPAVRLRLTRRGCLVLFVAAVLVLGLAGLVGARAVVADAPPQPMEVRAVVVEPGDTLWSYASGLTPAGEDVRDVVAQLVEMNELDASTLTVGQTLVLPVR